MRASVRGLQTAIVVVVSGLLLLVAAASAGAQTEPTVTEPTPTTQVTPPSSQVTPPTSDPTPTVPSTTAPTTAPPVTPTTRRNATTPRSTPNTTARSTATVGPAETPVDDSVVDPDEVPEEVPASSIPAPTIPRPPVTVAVAASEGPVLAGTTEIPVAAEAGPLSSSRVVSLLIIMVLVALAGGIVVKSRREPAVVDLDLGVDAATPAAEAVRAGTPAADASDPGEPGAETTTAGGRRRTLRSSRAADELAPEPEPEPESGELVAAGTTGAWIESVRGPSAVVLPITARNAEVARPVPADALARSTNRWADDVPVAGAGAAFDTDVDSDADADTGAAIDGGSDLAEGDRVGAAAGAPLGPGPVTRNDVLHVAATGSFSSWAAAAEQIPSNPYPPMLARPGSDGFPSLLDAPVLPSRAAALPAPTGQPDRTSPEPRDTNGNGNGNGDRHEADVVADDRATPASSPRPERAVSAEDLALRLGRPMRSGLPPMVQSRPPADSPEVATLFAMTRRPADASTAPRRPGNGAGPTD